MLIDTMKIQFSALFVFALCFQMNAGAQGHAENIAKLKSLQEAQNYAESNPGVEVAFMHSKLDNESYTSRMDTLKIGDCYSVQFYRICVVASGEKKLYHFRLFSFLEDQIPNARELADAVADSIQSGVPFETMYNRYSGKTDVVSADVGWVDPDYFIPSFREDLLNKHAGEVYATHDSNYNWHNIVEILEEPQMIEGNYVIYFPEEIAQSGVQVDHDANLDQLKSSKEITDYINEHDDVQLQLFNALNNPDFFKKVQLQKEKVGRKKMVIVDSDDRRYRLVKDTTVELFSFQYIYLDGSKYSKERKNEIIKEIYDRYNAGTSFDVLVKEYWPENTVNSKLEGVEGALLVPEMVEKLQTTEVGKLFVARTSQSYFLGVPLREPEKVDAVLMIGYPVK